MRTSSKLKMLADNDLKDGGRMMEFVFDRIESIVKKGENADGQHFLLLSKCFQKTSCCWSQKRRMMW